MSSPRVDGLYLDHGRLRQPLGQRAEDVRGGDGLVRPRRRRYDAGGPLDDLLHARGQHVGEGIGQGRDRTHHSQVCRAECGLVGVLGDHDDAGAWRDERAFGPQVLPEGGAAGHQHEVVGGERGAEAVTVCREIAGEARQPWSKPARAACASDQTGEPSRSARRARADHPSEVSVPEPTTRAGRSAPSTRAAIRATAGRVGPCAGGERLGRRQGDGVVCGLGPVAHRDDDDRRPAVHRGVVEGAGDDGRQVLGTRRLTGGDGVVTGQAVQLPARNGSDAMWRRSC